MNQTNRHLVPTPKKPGILRPPSATLMTPPYTGELTLAFLLDRTGSMDMIRNETVTAYNEFLMLMTEKAPNGRMSLAQFDSEGIDGLYWDKPMEEALMLTTSSFDPRGGTNLWDAVGWLADRMGLREAEARKIFVVLSDGDENCSSRWTLEMVRNMVMRYTKAGWTFVMLGTGGLDRDAAQAMGFPDGNIYLFDQHNVKAAVEALGKGILGFLGSRETQTNRLFLAHKPTDDAGGGAIAL